METVEIKKRVLSSSLCEVVRNGAAKLYGGQWNWAETIKVWSKDYLLQVMHQCAVLDVNTGDYACASKTDLLYTGIVYEITSNFALYRAVSDAVG